MILKEPFSYQDKTEIRQNFNYKKMDNNDKNLQYLSSSSLSKAVLQWLENQISKMYGNSKKRIDTSVIINDIFLQPFLGKFLLKVNYEHFSKTQLMDYIESGTIRKLSFVQRKLKYVKTLEKYLQERERKKFSPKYRQFWYEDSQNRDKQCLSQEMIKLILFAAIRSQNKNEFIERIFNMSAEKQRDLMSAIMQVQNNLENITQKEELALQLTLMKNLNHNMKENYQQLVDYQNKLLDQCEKQIHIKNQLQLKAKDNYKQKVEICEQLNIGEVQRPYLKIYKNFIEKNLNLTRILTQKQNKENQLSEQRVTLKQKIDQFEEVLFQLDQQRKKLKVILNDKTNQSFQLEMRASLSHERQSFRKSQVLRKRSGSFLNNSLKDGTNFSNHLHENTMIRAKSKYEAQPKLNESISLISKIQELMLQRQALAKEVSALKQTNKVFKTKNQKNMTAFSSLTQIYSQISGCLKQKSFSLQPMQQKQIEIQRQFSNKEHEFVKKGKNNLQIDGNISKQTSKRYQQMEVN